MQEKGRPDIAKSFVLFSRARWFYQGFRKWSSEKLRGPCFIHENKLILRGKIQEMVATKEKTNPEESTALKGAQDFAIIVKATS